MNVAYLLKRSTMTMIFLYPSDLGKAMIKSIETLSHSLYANDRGFNNLVRSLWLVLSCWRTRQVHIYASMLYYMCGQKYEAWTSAVVCLTLGWLAHSELWWHSLTTSYLKFPHINMNSRSPLVKKMPLSHRNCLVFLSRTFPNKSFARGYC